LIDSDSSGLPNGTTSDKRCRRSSGNEASKKEFRAALALAILCSVGH